MCINPDGNRPRVIPPSENDRSHDLPNLFRVEAAATAVYLLNFSPTKAVMNQTTMYLSNFSPLSSNVFVEFFTYKRVISVLENT
jgi:hypothetical protein